MTSNYDSAVIQEQVTTWRWWLENFKNYSNEAVLRLDHMYNQNPEIAVFSHKYHKYTSEFLSRAI